MSAPPSAKDLAARNSAANGNSAAFGLLDLIQGSVITQALYVAASLGIADLLKEGPLSIDEIADATGADPESTYRLLRALSGYSIFSQTSDGRFELTPMADALREDAPDSMHGIALLMGHPLLWEEWGHLLTAVKTGEASLPAVRGMGPFEFLMANPEYAATFFRGMASMSDPETGPVLDSCDFSRFGKIIDVGGGRGALLAGILQRASGASGILFDAPHATGPAAGLFEAAGVAGRCTIENGSYFEGVPSGGDAYLLKHTLHDFTEEQCLAVLSNVRNAISSDGTLFIFEYVLAGQNERHIGNIVDLWLLLMLGAKERTSDQYAELLSKAGFKLANVIPTACPVSIIEALPA